MLNLLLLIAAYGQSDARIEATDKRLASALTDTAAVGLSVAVMEGDRLAYAKGFGYADLEAKRPASERTIYRLGSISKSVTAVAAMAMKEAGQLDLDAPIREYVPQWPAKHPPLTARQILSHTAGIRHYNASEGTVFKYFARPVDALVRFANDDLIARPGEKFSYSTHAYTLLAAAMESAGKSDFRSLLRTHALRPARTTLDLELLHESKPDRTQLYVPGNEGPILQTKREDNSWKFAGGGMESDATSLARWANELLQGRLLKQVALKELWTPVKVPGGPEPTYALGFTVQNPNLVGHNGAQQGCTTSMLIDRSNKTVVVIMTNTSRARNLGPLTMDLIRIWRAPDTR